MPNKITSTSSGNDRYSRRDFTAKSSVDKYGNKPLKDNAGNSRLMAKEDGDEEPDFSYQTKYSHKTYTDQFGDTKTDLSVLDDAFIDTLTNISKGLIDSRMFKVSKKLPDGSMDIETENQEITNEGVRSLQEIIDMCDQYKNVNKSNDQPSNITFRSIRGKKIEDLDEYELQFINHIADSIGVDAETLLTQTAENKLQTIGAICLKCKSEIVGNANFCQNCGEKVENRCSSCNSLIVKNANFCQTCGTNLK